MATPVFAQIQDVQITANRKKVDEQKSRVGGPVTVKTKALIYQVTVQNKRFTAIPEVQVKYAIYLADEMGGSTEKAIPVVHRGSETLTNLGPHQSVSFETKPFTLTTEELDAGYVYTTGASNRARDRVAGVWIRAYADGKMIGEYAVPSSVAKKYDWKD